MVVNRKVLGKEWLKFFEPVEITDDGITYGCRIFCPDDYDPAKKYPLVIVLHGGADRGTDNECQVTGGLPVIWMQLQRSGQIEDIIIAAPQQNPQFGFFDESECVRATMDYLESHYSIDTDRIYLTGSSMGGMGSWSEAAKYPDRIAAILPCDGAYPDGRYTFPVGGISPAFEGDEVREEVTPEEYEGAMDRYARVLKKMPIWMFQSEADEVAPPSFACMLAEHMVKGEAENFKFTLIPKHYGIPHTTTYRVLVLMETPVKWLLSQRLSDRETN